MNFLSNFQHYSEATSISSQSSKSMPQPLILKKLKLNNSMKTFKKLLEITSKKDVLFIIGDWNAKVGSREVPGLTSKFGLGVQNEAGQRLTVLPRECTGHRKHNLSTTRDNTTHGHHQMVNTEIRLIIFFASEDGEALYNQQKQDWELTVAQIMNFLLQNSDLN